MSTGANRFSLRLSERRLLVGFLDIVLLNLTLYIIVSLSFDLFERTVPYFFENIDWFIVLTVVWLAVGRLFNIYDLITTSIPLRSIWVASAAAILTGMIYWSIPYLPPPLPTRRLFLFGFPLAAAGIISLWRFIYATIFVQPNFEQRAVVIGAGKSGTQLAQAVAQLADEHPNAKLSYRLVGFVDDDPTKHGTDVEDIPVLGDSAKLSSVLRQLKPNELVLAITNLNSISNDLMNVILDCREMDIPVTSMPVLYERLTGRVPVEHVGRNLSYVLPANSASHRTYLLMQRVVDIVGALIGCLILALLMPVIWLVNRFTDPGDLFYRQVRVGKGGQPYKVIKFRSMVMDAEKFSGAVWAEEDDPRITPVGRFMRKTRIDEVPQFWNVLKGEMSLVGPRPERPHFVEQLAEEIPYYRARHAVKPGITGWAQVKYRYGASVEDSLIKLEYDLYYIKRQSLWLDFEIFVRTVQVMLGFKGR